MEVVNFLLQRHADVHAEAGFSYGVTALQAAAITGDLMVAKLLISNGADVNQIPSWTGGRYAIEGAAEHGRLDMVRMLLNAGVVSNHQTGRGFAHAIKLAEQNAHFAITNMLQIEETRTKPRR